MNAASALTWATERLAAAQIESPRLDARLLLQWASDLDTVRLISEPDIPLTAGQLSRFDLAIANRCAGSPVARIIGEKEFWGLKFHLSRETLVPRPDTETLVEAILDRIERPRTDWPGRICDLGTGCGAILIALMHELPCATGIGVDLSQDAIATARRNGERHGMEKRIGWLCGDFGNVPDGRFDIVVSNPPYIAAAEIAGLAPEVREYDPHLALNGGCEGLDAYRTLAARLPHLLEIGGLAALELGAGQAEKVTALTIGHGLKLDSVHSDIAGIPRVLLTRSQ